MSDRELNKQLETTKERHTADGQYSEERQTIHRDIIGKHLEGLRTSSEPTVYFLGGGTASGKTTVSEKLLGSIKEVEKQDALVIDSDRIKTMLPEYERLKQQDPENMARILHDESSDIATKLYQEGLKQKVTMIFDGTMKSPEKYERFIESAKTNDYKSAIVIADVTLEEAKKRAEIRFEIENRRVPDEIIASSHKGVAKSFHQLKNQVDAYYLYDNMGKSPKAFMVKENNYILVKGERIEQFYAKGDISLEDRPKLKDLLMRVEGIPSGTSLDSTKLNREVVDFEVQKIDGDPNTQLKVRLKGDEHSLDIKMEHNPYFGKEQKKELIEQASKEVAAADRNRELDRE